MKKLLILLFVLTLPVFAGNEPTSEIEHTENQWIVELYKKPGLIQTALGVVFSTAGFLAAVSSYDVERGPVVLSGLIGIGLVTKGCHLSFILLWFEIFRLNSWIPAFAGVLSSGGRHNRHRKNQTRLV